MLRWRGLVRIVVAVGLTLALSGVVVLAQAACTRTYRGDLVLEGNERLVITEGVLCVGGEIILRDNARLEISNATLRMTELLETVYDSWSHIYVQDAAHLVMHDVHVETHGSGRGGVQVHVWANARAHFVEVRPRSTAGIWINAAGSSSVIAENSALSQLRLFDRAGVRLSSSSVSDILCLQFAGAQMAELSGLRPGVYHDWSLPRGSEPGFQLSLDRTNVRGWAVHVHDRAHITVRDSVLSGLNVGLAQLPALIPSMRSGYFTEWRIREDRYTGGDGDLVLLRTSVDWWVLALYGHQGAFRLADSSIGGLFTGGSELAFHLENVSMDVLVPKHGQVTLDCAPLTVSTGLELRSVRLVIRGSLLFPNPSPRVVWNNSSVGREYEVQVRDNDGDPVRGVRIGLEDPNGRVTHRTTDQEGVVRFTIWFQNRNYDHTWHLLVPQGDTTARVPITLLTSTPVEVTSW